VRVAKLSPWIIGVSLVSLSGCAGYQPKPIVPQEVLRDLRQVRLEALRPVEPVSSSTAPALDLADGLSADEAVVAGLFLNPGLRSFRKERGVAEGELVAAKLLSNPELEITWLYIENFTKSFMTGGFDIGLRWSPPRPGERAAKSARAEARIGEVRAQIADEEWRLAADIRKAHAALWGAQERRRYADAALALQERVRKFIRDKRDLGDASRLEANLIELEYFETVRERVAILSEEERARLELNRLLGLPPRLVLPLQPGPVPMTYRAFGLEPNVLETTMIDRRPGLAAAKEEYEQAEQSLRLAYIQRIPWFRFGPVYEQDAEPGGSAVNKFGLSFGIELPLFNLNQGEIARLEASRDKLRDGFSAKVHAARAEVHDAEQVLRTHERVVRLFADVIRPALDENAELTDAALALGDVNVLQFVTAQSKVLKGRRDLIEAHIDYWKAVFDLERALGARLEEIDGRKE
jgi:outer membrane protein TolC